MFSPALGRVRTTSSGPKCVAATLSATHQTLSRPSHQRRLSSSKASIPPDGSNGSSSAHQTPAASATKAPTRSLKGRTSKKKSASPPTLNVPHVPPTDYLRKPEVRLSSFFSLHRPMSVTHAVPPLSTNASFDSIFQPRAPNDKQAMMGNIQALSSGINQLEAILKATDQKQPEEAAQAEGQVRHLDGPPQATIENLVSKFIPFKPPPVPQPLGEAAEPETMTSQTTGENAVSTAPVSQRIWRTAVVVTESLDASGKRTFSATSAPIVEMDLPPRESDEGVAHDESMVRQPFLGRMRQRQNSFDRYRESQDRPDMQLISVKRQRKLKMKKHKYKKLMKRTRLERRKLGRT